MGGGRKGSGGERGSGFRETLSDVTPLDGPEKLAPRPTTLRRRRRHDDASGVDFEIDRLGERIEGVAPGVDRKLLRKLRSGEFARDARLDLHGLDAPTAKRRVHELLLRVHGEGGRCVLVIHGRGKGSEGTSVLKEALPGWLAEAPVGPLVLAFTSAQGRDGGVGATYVLLRRG